MMISTGSSRQQLQRMPGSLQRMFACGLVVGLSRRNCSCQKLLSSGAIYNLKDMQLEIKADRETELIDEIDSVLNSNLLGPGSAGKLKGPLMFGASQVWGKVRRAFLRPISERQYWKMWVTSEFVLDSALTEALKQWKHLVQAGPPGPIDVAQSKPANVVIFAGPRFSETLPDRI